MRLDGRTAIITGGANGIGKATVKRFAEEGAKIAVWDVVEGAGKELAAEIAQAGGQAYFDKVDVTNKDEVEEAVDKAIFTWGQIDILINNAGILRDGQLVKFKDGEMVGSMSEEDFDSVIKVNLRGVFVCTQAVVPHMIEKGYGRILNASSVVGLYGNFGQTNYVATKAGVIGMTKVWAREFGRYGITVNAVAPGFIETEMVKQIPEKIMEGMVSRTPLKRMGQPKDVANAYLFLSSDEASFISGAVLSVDGGAVVGT